MTDNLQQQQQLPLETMQSLPPLNQEPQQMAQVHSDPSNQTPQTSAAVAQPQGESTSQDNTNIQTQSISTPAPVTSAASADGDSLTYIRALKFQGVIDRAVASLCFTFDEFASNEDADSESAQPTQQHRFIISIKNLVTQPHSKQSHMINNILNLCALRLEFARQLPEHDALIAQAQVDAQRALAERLAAKDKPEPTPEELVEEARIATYNSQPVFRPNVDSDFDLISEEGVLAPLHPNATGAQSSKTSSERFPTLELATDPFNTSKSTAMPFMCWTDYHLQITAKPSVRVSFVSTQINCLYALRHPRKWRLASAKMTGKHCTVPWPQSTDASDPVLDVAHTAPAPPHSDRLLQQQAAHILDAPTSKRRRTSTNLYAASAANSPIFGGSRASTPSKKKSSVSSQQQQQQQRRRTVDNAAAAASASVNSAVHAVSSMHHHGAQGDFRLDTAATTQQNSPINDPNLEKYLACQHAPVKMTQRAPTSLYGYEPRLVHLLTECIIRYLSTSVSRMEVDWSAIAQSMLQAASCAITPDQCRQLWHCIQSEADRHGKCENRQMSDANTIAPLHYEQLNVALPSACASHASVHYQSTSDWRDRVPDTSLFDSHQLMRTVNSPGADVKAAMHGNSADLLRQEAYYQHLAAAKQHDVKHAADVLSLTNWTAQHDLAMLHALLQWQLAKSRQGPQLSNPPTLQPAHTSTARNVPQLWRRFPMTWPAVAQDWADVLAPIHQAAQLRMQQKSMGQSYQQPMLQQQGGGVDALGHPVQPLVPQLQQQHQEADDGSSSNSQLDNSVWRHVTVQFLKSRLAILINTVFHVEQANGDAVLQRALELAVMDVLGVVAEDQKMVADSMRAANIRKPKKQGANNSDELAQLPSPTQVAAEGTPQVKAEVQSQHSYQPSLQPHQQYHQPQQQQMLAVKTEPQDQSFNGESSSASAQLKMSPNVSSAQTAAAAAAAAAAAVAAAQSAQNSPCGAQLEAPHELAFPMKLDDMQHMQQQQQQQWLPQL